MLRVGVRELKEQASEIVRRVREESERIEVTYRGRTVALMVPVRQQKEELSVEEFRKLWDKARAQISEDWPQGVSAVDAIRDVRRDL